MKGLLEEYGAIIIIAVVSIIILSAFKDVLSYISGMVF